ncbi:hypothetical protein AVEN_79445-1 [Araneus ventricosus]|uniref:Uncharacterized protein n=1 Tax=Araneus ventricosus TaxID=182803 RepID=A0A4Y2NIB0_ARAVE|nr:hypothetical protein AVEN_79445-1 [Araneus ventricosus]
MQTAEDAMIGIPDSSTITKVAVVDRKPEEVAGEPAMPGNELHNLRMEESRLGKDMRDVFSRLLAIPGKIPPVLPSLQEFISNFPFEALCGFVCKNIDLVKFRCPSGMVVCQLIPWISYVSLDPM